MLINSLAKKHVVFTKSGMVLSFDKRHSNLNLSVSGYDVTVPIDYSQLEIVNFLNHTLADAKRGHLKQNAWENPEIQLDGQFNCAQRMSLSYYIMLSFVNNSVCGTRDIWLVFRNMHHSLVSYLRNRAIANKILLRYKVAILICYLKGYSISPKDISKMEKVFEKCGLNRQNYIFYLMFLLDGTFEDITFDVQDKFLLTVAAIEDETQDFINDPSIARLCMYHTQKSLSFIVKSHNMSPFDMANELRIATQIAYTTARPLKSRAHSENHARRSMTNMVSRIIHAHTKYEGNVRLVSTDNGSEGTHILFNELGDHNFDPTWNDDNAKASVYYNEDSMIDYLDAKRASQ